MHTRFGKHLAASAVYDFTQMAHEVFHEPLIHALVETSNEMARHVIEHNGYSIIGKENDTIIYEHRIPETRSDDNYNAPDGQKTLYLAGGCFWGTERVFKILKGVTDTKTGYANGHTTNPSYEQICRMETGFKETVRVTYNPAITPTEKVLKAYFLCIDPEQADATRLSCLITKACSGALTTWRWRFIKCAISASRKSIQYVIKSFILWVRKILSKN